MSVHDCGWTWINKFINMVGFSGYGRFKEIELLMNYINHDDGKKKADKAGWRGRSKECILSKGVLSMLTDFLIIFGQTGKCVRECLWATVWGVDCSILCSSHIRMSGRIFSFELECRLHCLSQILYMNILCFCVTREWCYVDANMQYKDINFKTICF